MSTNPTVERTAQKTEQKINEASAIAKDELNNAKAEFQDLQRRAQPKVQEAENFLTSPSAIGFYQGVIVGVFVVLGYVKYKGGLVL